VFTVTHWLKFRPLLVLTLLFIAPAAAVAHLMLTWGPEWFVVQRLTNSIPQSGQVIASRMDQLQQIRAMTARLEQLTQHDEEFTAQCWLPTRQRNHVSDALAAALGAADVTLDQLTFEDPALFTAAPQGEVLACERVAVACHGSYGGLTECLNRLGQIGFPIRATHVKWQRTDAGVELTLEIQIPFAPDADLARALRVEAGLEVEEGDDES
jgi:hypothetical protein